MKISLVVRSLCKVARDEMMGPRPRDTVQLLACYDFLKASLERLWELSVGNFQGEDACEELANAVCKGYRVKLALAEFLRAMRKECRENGIPWEDV